MDYFFEDRFYFLEKSQYFYKKTSFKKMAQEGHPKLDKDEEVTYNTYTFYNQENSYQTVAEILIPIRCPLEDIKWKYTQINETTKKPVYQSNNDEILNMPLWFRLLIIEALNIYEQSVILFRCFAPEKNKTEV
ncbi:hypothetical protein [Bacillus toyonensis]|uniref:hypothetical protein n=1 Tax=Bacillus toyonensis TaxID=155322 RepID=UPI002E1C06BF|nr:hypothetical protein [Bacillus toyonensis]